MWSKFKEFTKKNWIAFIALVVSFSSFIFHRNRRSGLGDSKQLCADIGEGITNSKDGIDSVREELASNQSQVESIVTRIDKLSKENITAGDIVRKYQSRNNSNNESK